MQEYKTLVHDILDKIELRTVNGTEELHDHVRDLFVVAIVIILKDIEDQNAVVARVFIERYTAKHGGDPDFIFTGENSLDEDHLVVRNMASIHDLANSSLSHVSDYSVEVGRDKHIQGRTASS